MVVTSASGANRRAALEETSSRMRCELCRESIMFKQAALTLGLLAAAGSAQAGTTLNALSVNALSTNALTNNALTNNALTQNALTQNALVDNALTSNALVSNALVSNGIRHNGLSVAPIERNGLRVIEIELPSAR
jgi:hypothetical protein